MGIVGAPLSGCGLVTVGQAIVVPVPSVAPVVPAHLGLLLRHLLLLVQFLDGLDLLLQLHPPVLEPDLDLPLRQAQRVGDLDPPPPGQVAVEVEFLF